MLDADEIGTELGSHPTRRLRLRIASKARPLVLGMIFAAVIACAPAIAAAPEHVDIPDGDLTLHASLYRPDGAGPFPAVVALHDCGGLVHYRPITETRHYVEWARLLVADGFVVLFPDSFGSRGIGPQCRERDRKVRASRERVTDANAARHWLQAQSYVKPDRVSLLGWSNGGIAALWTVRPTDGAARRQHRFPLRRHASIRAAADCATPPGARACRRSS